MYQDVAWVGGGTVMREPGAALGHQETRSEKSVSESFDARRTRCSSRGEEYPGVGGLDGWVFHAICLVLMCGMDVIAPRRHVT